MPRVCTICVHPQRGEIDQALLTGESLRDIARQWRVSKDAIARHRDANHMASHLVQAHEAEEVAQADHLTAELKRIMQRVNLLFDACDQWLRDPDNPSQYDLGPRAEDVRVVYVENHDGEVRRRKAPLSTLLERVEEQGVTVKHVEWRHADPRELILSGH